MSAINQYLLNKLKQRTDKNTLRSLSINNPPIDFCSNDYLGFAKSTILKEKIDKEISKLNNYTNGSGGSRLLSGNTKYTEETEQFIADFHKVEAGLIFNSGYDANIGLLSAVPQRNDTIITDERIHASLIDGARLSFATRYSFKHNDLKNLEDKLNISTGNIFVVVESVYSMDGDFAPLQELNILCKQYQANLIIDEAHATGLFGEKGQGLVNQFGLENEVFARIVTFGKAIGCHGAIILGNNLLRNYLINFSRSFIYTTAAPIHNIIAIKCAYELLLQTNYPSQMNNKINLFNQLVNQKGLKVMQSYSAIQGVLFSSNASAKLAAQTLQQQCFDIRAILSPTVAEGKERLRICLHTYNTDEEIIELVNALENIQKHG